MTTNESKTDARAGASSSETAGHHILLASFVLLWGGNFILAEMALREMAPISFSAARFVMGGGMLVAVLWVQRTVSGGQVFPALRSGDWPRLLLVSVLGGTLAPWLGIEGLNLTHGARASLWLALGPVVSSGVGYIWHTERIGWVGYVGIGLAGFGTVALAADGWQTGSYWLGDLLLFLALLMAVVELHLIKPLAARYGSLPMAAARTSLGGLLYLLIASPALAGEPWLRLGVWTWIAILIGGGIGVGLGQWVKIRALDVLGPTRVVIYGNLVPVATLILAWLTVGTDPSWVEVGAGGLIVMGTYCLEVLDVSAHETPTRPSPPSETTDAEPAEVSPAEAQHIGDRSGAGSSV